MPFHQVPQRLHCQIFLFIERGVPLDLIEEVSQWFVRNPGPVSIVPQRRSVELPVNEAGAVTWPDAFVALAKLRTENELPPDAFVYLLMKSPNEENWFAVQDPDEMRNGFGHVDDFSWVTSAPASVIVAHYLLKSVYNALLTDSGVSWIDLWHQEPRGCFFDFCVVKRDLNFKLRTADICGDCMEVFRSIGFPDALLTQTVAIMEESRPLALNTSQFRRSLPQFERWPFPVAVTRHKVTQATNPLLRFMLLLDHFDSMIRYFYLTRELLADRQPVVDPRPSLGWWLNQLAQSLKGERRYREIVAVSQRENVVALRNERRGHGWMSANPEAYEADAEALERTIRLLETELEPFFHSHRLVIPRQTEPVGEVYTAKGDSLTGSHVLHPPLEVTLRSDPLSVGLRRMNEVFVTDAAHERFHLASPFIRSAICPTCHHPRILITDGGDCFIDVFMGHRVHLNTACA